MKLWIAAGSLAVLVGCGNGASTGGAAGGGGSASSANAGGSDSSGSPDGGSSGSEAGGHANSTSSSGGAGGGSSAWKAGNDGACTAGVPAEGKAVDSSNPTTVVGNGSAASCTFDALKSAIAKGGVITFKCGGDATIAITATLDVPIDKDTVMDGGQKVTLDGQKQVRILSFDSANWQNNEHRLTLQHIALANGKATPTVKIPDAPAPCSQGWNDGQGGAVYMRDGNLTVVDAIFTGNEAAPLGPDTGGGAIYVQGSKHGTVISGSTFEHNQAANAGALGGLFCEHHVYDSVFTNNAAIGHDANNNQPDKCKAMNNGQNETGSGGNGGAIYSDGINVNLKLCGALITDNAAGTNAFGGGLFFTSNNFAGDLSIVDTTMMGNTGGSWTNAQTGSMKSAGTAVGTNCHSLTITNSHLQGLN